MAVYIIRKELFDHSLRYRSTQEYIRGASDAEISLWEELQRARKLLQSVAEGEAAEVESAIGDFLADVPE